MKIILAFLLLSACAKASNASTPVPSDQTQSHQDGRLVTNQTVDVLVEKSGVLDPVATIPIGTVLTIPENYHTSYLPYRKPDGSLGRSSTGFAFPIHIESVPTGSSLSPTQIDQLNSAVGGLHVTAVLLGDAGGTDGNFNPVPASQPGSGFLAHFQSNGQPKFNYSKSVAKRFGPRLNKGVDPRTMPPELLTKSQSLYQELKRAADRTVTTPKALLMIPHDQAMSWSEEYEKTGAISPNGAWSIAVLATAVRHGFPNVPCAEFMSEMVREAYQRAGYRVTDDFNSKRGNVLIWSNTAAVVNFSKALYEAGWIPWDTRIYRAPIGALMMNGAGETPGHTFIAAGRDGRLIVDNGSPGGRDLQKTAGSTINMMYEAGVFFLPPGINPQPW